MGPLSVSWVRCLNFNKGPCSSCPECWHLCPGCIHTSASHPDQLPLFTNTPAWSSWELKSLGSEKEVIFHNKALDLKQNMFQLLVVAGKPKSCVQEHQKVGKRAPRCAKMLSAACQTHLTLSYHGLGWGLSKIWHNGFARAGTDCAICLKMLHTKLRTKLQTKLQTCMWDFTRTTSPQAGWLQAKCHTHRRTSKGAARCSQTEMRPNSLPAAVPEVPSQTNCLSSVYSSYQAQWLSRKADMRTKQRDCTAFTCDACVAIPFLNK